MAQGLGLPVLEPHQQTLLHRPKPPAVELQVLVQGVHGLDGLKVGINAAMQALHGEVVAQGDLQGLRVLVVRRGVVCGEPLLQLLHHQPQGALRVALHAVPARVL